MLLLALALAQEAPINLVCGGGGIHRRVDVATGQVTSGADTAQGSIQYRSSEGYGDEVHVELAGDTGRIRVPAGMRPRLTYGGNDGWWPLRDIRYSRDEITGKFTLNFMNRPSVRIDRLTGHISIQGRSGSYAGACQPYDPENVARRF